MQVSFLNRIQPAHRLAQTNFIQTSCKKYAPVVIEVADHADPLSKMIVRVAIQISFS